MRTLTVSIAALLLTTSLSAADDKVHQVGKAGLKFTGKLGPGQASQVYLVNLVQGGTYVMDMTSPNPRALDPYLRLLDPTGKVLAVDDDGGDRYLSARLIFLAPATADYKIEATSADGTNASIPAGPFTLVVRRDDSKQADALEKRLEELRGKRDYSAAVAAAGALLKARQGSQSTKQWQIADARGLMQRLEKIAALPDKARAELPEAAKQAAIAGQLQGRRKYRDAEPFYEKALAIHRKILGQEHPDTASSCDSLADNLDAQGRHAEAARLREDVLVICRKTWGEIHPNTAQAYNNLALNLNGQGKYADATPFYEKALAICRETLGEEHPHTATTYNNFASNLDAQGKNANAAPLLDKALAIRRKVLGEDHPVTATSYSNLAGNLHAQGKYADATPLYEKTLVIFRKTLDEDHLHTAQGYNNLGVNLDAQGKYADAAPLLLKALDIRRKILTEEHPLTASSYSNLGGNLEAQKRFAEATPLYEKALRIFRKTLGARHPHTAQACNNLASSLGAQRQYAAAAPLLKEALAIRQRALGEQHPLTATSYSNLGLNLKAQSEYANATPLYEKTLAILHDSLGEEHPHTAQAYNNLGHNLIYEGKYGDAEVFLSKGARTLAVARLRSNASGMERASFAAKHSAFAALPACRARTGKARAAWESLEAGLARGLLDDLSARQALPLTAAEQAQQQDLSAALNLADTRIGKLLAAKTPDQAVRKQLAELIEQRKKPEASLGQLAATLAERQVFALERIQKRIPADAALLAWVDIKGEPKAHDPNGEHWACVLRRTGLPAWVKLPGSGGKGIWTKEDNELPRRIRLALASPSAASAPDLQALREKLSAQRLAPVTPYLAARAGLPAVNRLIVVPVGWLAGVPLEALSHDYVVSYIPSGSMWTRLQEENKSTIGSTLLAVGDPVFRPVEKADRIVQASRGDDYDPLPGSRVEVEAIARLWPPQATLKLLGSEASEQKLAELAARAELKNYRYVHFATHGDVNAHAAFQSAIILSQDRLPDPADALRGGNFLDGRLSAAELLNWKLDADMVVFSACQSGLGQEAGGEGYLGFSQALFIAGARSVVVSLWKVNDTATALLMTRFYENLLGKRAGLKAPLSKTEALKEAQSWLRNLSTEEVKKESLRLPPQERTGRAKARVVPAAEGRRPFAHPYYWAAFILIGDPD